MFNKSKFMIVLFSVVTSMSALVNTYAADENFIDGDGTASYNTENVDDLDNEVSIEYNGVRYIYFDTDLCPHIYNKDSGLYEIYKGPVKPGWIKYQKKWYYLNDDGSKKTGWFNDNGKWYYLYKTGAMAEDVQIEYWHVGKDGVWDGKTQAQSIKMEASIKTEKDTYEKGISKINYTLTNNTVDEMGLGMDCVLEKYDNGKWSLAPTKEKLVFLEIECLIEPCKSYDEVFSLEPYEELTPGLYRLNYEGMYAEFKVE